MRRALIVVALAALALASTAAAFTPADPLAGHEWYLQDDHAFDAWPTPPTLAPVKVAIVDSGIDNTLPDFTGRILDARSFVGGSPYVDTVGHGTFVAGLIAANLDTQGMVGIAYSSQLLIAKVTQADGSIPLDAEVNAIRWAADEGAQVINLSLSGVRDPVHLNRDTYSPAEAAAIAYAYAKGAVVVAAVGNADEAYATPWPFAGYPAALPHVLGVSALLHSGNVPDYSNRDPLYNDISAPGSGIFSTFPTALTAQRATCADQGYSDCALNDEYRNAEGTSFAAPQVAAAAAVLFGLVPTLTNGQVMYILEHSADDMTAASGCPRCALGRDPYSGWGRLDLAKAVGALSGPLPPPDRLETNDDAGPQAKTLWGGSQRINATLDYYDDPVDVYRVQLRAHQKLTASLTGWQGASVQLELWRPGTRQVDVKSAVHKLRAAQSAGAGAHQQFRYVAPKPGWYYVEAKTNAPGSGQYSLKLTKR